MYSVTSQGKGGEAGPDPGEQHGAGGEPGRRGTHHPGEPHPHHLLHSHPHRGGHQDRSHQGGNTHTHTVNFLVSVWKGC